MKLITCHGGKLLTLGEMAGDGGPCAAADVPSFRTGLAALDALASIDPDELTPKQALEALYRLKALT